MNMQSLRWCLIVTQLDTPVLQLGVGYSAEKPTPSKQ